MSEQLFDWDEKCAQHQLKILNSKENVDKCMIVSNLYGFSQTIKRKADRIASMSPTDIMLFQKSTQGFFPKLIYEPNQYISEVEIVMEEREELKNPAFLYYQKHKKKFLGEHKGEYVLIYVYKKGKEDKEKKIVQFGSSLKELMDLADKENYEPEKTVIGKIEDYPDETLL